MTELEIAFAGLIILIGAGAIIYAGVKAPTGKADKAAASNDSGAPIIAEADQSTPGDGGGGGI